MSRLAIRGSNVTVRSMSVDDVEALSRAAADGELWNSTVTMIPRPEAMQSYVESALADRSMEPFCIVGPNGDVVGSSRYFKIDQANRTREIGYTWIATSWQRSVVNTECKYLLLRYAFETLDCLRVQFLTDELNQQSRDAILRIGAKFEGVIRNHLIMPSGRKRSSAMYSIIDEEWPPIREELERKLRERGLEPRFKIEC